MLRLKRYLMAGAKKVIGTSMLKTFGVIAIGAQNNFSKIIFSFCRD